MAPRDSPPEPVEHIRHLASAGVGEVPWIAGLAAQSATSVGSVDEPSSPPSTDASGPSIRRRLANDLIREEGVDGLDAALTTVGRRMFGHMVMTVARPARVSA